MKVGNKLHAVLLSIVGVGAIFALIFQVKARMTPPNGQRTTANATTPLVASVIPSNLPRMVYGDPFSHPKLPRVNPAAKKVNPEPTAGGLPVRTPPPHLAGDLSLSPLIPNVRADGAGVAKSAEPPPRAPSICLQAIVSAPDPVAFISIDGKEPQQFSVGDTIVAGVAISRIDESEIQLGGATGTRHMRVGDKVQL